MVDTLHIIVQFTPECFSKFHGYLQNNHENIEEEEEGILQYISDESNNADMHENGCIVSIEDNELAFMIYDKYPVTQHHTLIIQCQLCITVL